MKRFYLLFFSILTAFLCIYPAFLFVLPNVIDLNKYSPQIKKIIQDTAGTGVDIRGLKVKTSWDLGIGAYVEKVDLLDLTEEKFAQINGLKINISLWNFIMKRKQIDKIEADKVLANIDIEKYKNTKHKDGSNYTEYLPRNINVKQYRISLLRNDKNYTLKGDNFRVCDFVTGKRINVKTDGQLILNKRKQITYDIAVKSEAPAKFFLKTKSQKSFEDIIKILDDLYKYNINADINADLAVKDKNGEANFEGRINIDKLFFTVNNKVYPHSNLKLTFNGDKVKINSSLNVDKTSKAIITGVLKTGRNKFIDLHVKSDEINIKDVLLIAKSMSSTIGLQKLKNIKAEGVIKADFNLKSNFKKVESDGYLKIKNARIANDLYKVNLNSLNADIDLSKNTLHIIQASANLNGQPVVIKGRINQNADANLSILANSLQLKSVLFTLGNFVVLKENDIQSGRVDINAALTGRLDKAVPKINAAITDVNLRNVKSKAQIKLAKAVLNFDSKNVKNGIIVLSNLNIGTPAAVISIPKADLKLIEKDLTIENTYLYINGIKTSLSGTVSNIHSKPVLNSVAISIPGQISVPVKGYPASNALISGNLLINGELDNPKLSGAVNIPSVHLPSVSTNIKDVALKFDKTINLSCSQIQIANSIMSFNAQIESDFSNGIVVKNVNFYSNNIDLNRLIPVYKKLPQNTTANVTVQNGKGNIERFKTEDIQISNITTDIRFKDGVLELNNLLADSYYGKTAGAVKYDTKHEETSLQIQGREISAKYLLTALSGRDDDINGKLDFDGNLSMSGYGKHEIMKSLKGDIDFIIYNGKMGALGKFEHLIYAQNIISNNVFKTTLNVIAKAITVQNTGVYKYMKGKITFSNGWANIKWIKTSGPSMSLYITGRYYMPDNIASLTMLGRISDDVVRILGPIGEFSMNKAVSYIPKIGEITSLFIEQFTTNPAYENISQIPDLTPKTGFQTKEFKVIIDGDTRQQSSIKSFKWLSKPVISQSQTTYSLPQQKEQNSPIPDFVKNLPDFQNKD